MYVCTWMYSELSINELSQSRYSVHRTVTDSPSYGSYMMYSPECRRSEYHPMDDNSSPNAGTHTKFLDTQWQINKIISAKSLNNKEISLNWSEVPLHFAHNILVCLAYNSKASRPNPVPRLSRAPVTVAVMVLHPLARNWENIGENIGAILTGTLPTISPSRQTTTANLPFGFDGSRCSWSTCPSDGVQIAL